MAHGSKLPVANYNRFSVMLEAAPVAAGDAARRERGTIRQKRALMYWCAGTK